MPKLSDLSQRDRTILAILGAIVIFLIAYLLVVKPKFDEVSRINSELEDERQLLMSAKNHLERVKELERNFEVVEAKMTKAKKALPDSSAVPSTIVELSNIYKDEDIELTKLAPSALTDEVKFSSLLFQLQSTQDLSVYPIISLLRRIEANQRFVRIINIELTAVEADKKSGDTDTLESSTLTAVLSLKAFTTEKPPVVPGSPAAAPVKPAPTGQGGGG